MFIKIALKILVVLVVVAALALGVAKFVFPQEFEFAVTTLKQFGVQETVKLAYDFVTGNSLNEHDFQNNKQENDKQLRDEINNHGYTITDEQLEQLNSGTLNEDEIADILMGNVPAKEDAQNSSDEPQKVDDTINEQNPDNQNAGESLPGDDKIGGGTDSSDNEDKPSTNPQVNKEQNTTDEMVTNAQDPRIAKLIARMYVLKNSYMAQIEGIIGNMKAEYVTYPANERTTSLKASIATKYMNKINAMEAQCDAQVNAIVTEIRSALKQSGADESLADSILNAYKSEKSSTKSYYIGKYAD